MATKTNNPFKVLWALACASSSTDQNTNSISLFNVLEQIKFTANDPSAIKEIPADGIGIPANFDIVALIARTDNSNLDELGFNGTIVCVDPTGKELFEGPLFGKIEKGKKRLRATLRMNGIKVNQNGEYQFQLFLDKAKGTPDAIVPLDITLE